MPILTEESTGRTEDPNDRKASLLKKILPCHNFRNLVKFLGA